MSKSGISVMCVLFAVALVGCGDGRDTEKVGPQDPFAGVEREKAVPKNGDPAAQAVAKPLSLYVPAKADLPKCDAKAKSSLAYVVAEKKFFGCDGSAWAEVPMPAPQMPSTYIKSVTRCEKVDNNIGYRFSGTTLTSGDVLVTCAVEDSSRVYNETVLYSSKVNGSLSWTCMVVYDKAGEANSGWIEFDKPTPNLHRVKFQDQGGGGFLFRDSDCQTTTF